MSLASLLAAGVALGSPHRTVIAFSGDGAFVINPGMLLVERQLALPNLKHFLLSNRVYGSTNDLSHPFAEMVDYAGMAKAAGVERVYEFSTVEGLGQGLDDMVPCPDTRLPCCIATRSAGTCPPRRSMDRSSNTASAAISTHRRPADLRHAFDLTSTLHPSARPPRRRGPSLRDAKK